MKVDIGTLKFIRDSIEPFAEDPNKITDNYPCHSYIITKYECGRCSRAINAWKALKKLNTMLDNIQEGA